MSSVVCPGDRLRHSSEVLAGPGTYVREADGNVCAALAGVAHLLQPAADSQQRLPTAEVHRGRAAAVLPQPGSVVLSRVLSVSPRWATCEVVCVNGAAVDQPFSGIIRQQDVRATEVDKVVLQECFRPGDVVRCSVLSLGDQRSYYLSTASPELGVVYARSASSGQPLVAVDWTTMRDPVTGSIETRKVAKT
jgi:exosome complex component CSL4